MTEIDSVTAKTAAPVMAARAFRWTTLMLLVASLLPDLLIPDVDAPTRLTPVLRHLAVAAIVVPGTSNRLR